MKSLTKLIQEKLSWGRFYFLMWPDGKPMPFMHESHSSHDQLMCDHFEIQMFENDKQADKVLERIREMFASNKSEWLPDKKDSFYYIFIDTSNNTYLMKPKEVKGEFEGRQSYINSGNCFRTMNEAHKIINSINDYMDEIAK